MNLPGKRIDPGKMRQLLVFVRSTDPRNLSGGFGDNPETVFTVRGKLESMPVTGSAERFGPADWTTSRSQYKATIRRRSDVTTRMGIQFDGRVFSIRDAPQVAKSERYMEILCEEVAS